MCGAAIAQVVAALRMELWNISLELLAVMPRQAHDSRPQHTTPPAVCVNRVTAINKRLSRGGGRDLSWTS